MTNKHKHHDVLIAIAEGRESEVERNYDNQGWEPYKLGKHVSPVDSDCICEWRVKPVPKEPEYLYVYEQYIDDDIKCVSPILSTETQISAHHKCIGKIRLEPLDDN